MKYKMIPVFTADALAELIGVDEDDIRGKLLDYDYNNDSCVYWSYDEDFDPRCLNSEFKNRVNKRLREFDIPNYGVILIDVSW